MNSLFRSDGLSIPSLYVKSATSTYAIRSIFEQARWMSPCLLIFEDIDTVVTDSTRSYFFNEVDVSCVSLRNTSLQDSMLTTLQGLENNDGIFMVASTNHLDKLDAGLSSRPSRFDRKYLFPNPSEEERNLYCLYWRRRLKARKVEVEFPKKICPALALITDDFSFAYIQEAFVASLLAIAMKRSEGMDEDTSKVEGGGKDSDGDGDKDLNEYELWRELKKTVKLLREDMDNAPGKKPDKSTNVSDEFEKAFVLEKKAQAPAAASQSRLFEQAMNLSQLQEGKSKQSYVPYRIRGMTVDVDYQNVPLISDENNYIYKSV